MLISLIFNFITVQVRDMWHSVGTICSSGVEIMWPAFRAIFFLSGDHTARENDVDLITGGPMLLTL